MYLSATFGTFVVKMISDVNLYSVSIEKNTRTSFSPKVLVSIGRFACIPTCHFLNWCVLSKFLQQIFSGVFMIAVHVVAKYQITGKHVSSPMTIHYCDACMRRWAHWVELHWIFYIFLIIMQISQQIRHLGLCEFTSERLSLVNSQYDSISIHVLRLPFVWTMLIGIITTTTQKPRLSLIFQNLQPHSLTIIAENYNKMEISDWRLQCNQIATHRAHDIIA